MKRATRLWLAAGAAAALAAGGVRAAAEEKAEPRRRTVLHFGDDDIRGGLTRPDGELVQAPRKPPQESLLRVRRNFVDRALSAPALGR